MVKNIRCVQCDNCGRIEALVYELIRNEYIYELPEGWIKSGVSGYVTFCPECAKKLEVKDERRSL